jgi:integrase
MKADPTFPRVTAHDLRHTYASLAISSGANVLVVLRQLPKCYFKQMRLRDMVESLPGDGRAAARRAHG